MKRKKYANIFLITALAIFALCVIMIIAESIYEYNEIYLKQSENNPDMRFEQALLASFLIFFYVPFFAELLCLIKSSYQLIKGEYSILGNIFRSISAVLAFSAILFQILILTGVIDFSAESINKNLEMCVSTATPTAIMSLILGCIGKKKRESRV